MKESNLQTFQNADFGEIRTVTIEGEPWFVGKDVAAALGYGGDNSKSKALTNAISDHVDEEDKMHLSYKELKRYPDGDLKNFSHYGAVIINESGLYSLILSSKLPDAKKFKRWVTSEVIPSIRKHGGYLTPKTIEEILDDPDTIIHLATVLKEERETNRRLMLENNQQKQIIGELQPKARYYDQILDNKGLVTITQIAKDYGMSGRALNDILHDLGIQFKESGQWLLYKKYHNEGYTHSSTVEVEHKDGTKSVKMNTKWTQKGRLFLYELLKQHGILPVIEQDRAS